MASIEKRVTSKGKTVWRVRWSEAGRKRSKTFDRHSDARTEAARLRLLQQQGQLAALDRGRITLHEYMSGTWVPTYGSTLSRNTRRLYAYLYKAHIGPFLGSYSLREVTPEVIRRWLADLATAEVGAVARHKALGLLGNILQRALEGEHITGNPVRAVRPPRLPRSREVVPLSPGDVEAMRTAALRPAQVQVPASEAGKRVRRAHAAPAPGTAYTRHRDATLISVLAYAGLRPQEALALIWANVRERTILVYSPKTDRARTVRLLPPLAADLREFKMASGRPADDAPVFPGPDGGAWTKTAWDNWRGRTFARLLRDAKLTQRRPYDLRHSFASLLIHEGRSVTYIAKQLGHSATLTLNTYGHVIDELEEDGPRQDAADAIHAARSGTSPERPSRNVSSA